LSVANAPATVIDELRAKALSMSARDGLTDLQFATRELANEALDALRAQRCEIESLAPTTSTLEEVFVRTVEK